MKITVKVKNVYGVDRIYPVCEAAQTFAAFTGNKTLSPADIERIKALGYEIEVEMPTLEGEGDTVEVDRGAV